MPNDESMTKHETQPAPFACLWSFVIRNSAFSIHVALVALVVLKLLDVGVRFVHRLAALFLDDLAQRSIDIFRHASRVAANKKLGAFAVDPFPDFGGVFEHLVLDVNFMRLIARPRAIESRQKAFAGENFPVFLIGVIALLTLRPIEEPVFSFCAGSSSLLQKRSERRDPGTGSNHDQRQVLVFRRSE